jgi:structural maintenance of chromosome 1
LIKQKDQTVQTLREAIHTVEDKVFASFCETLGVSNIREYEDNHLSSARVLGEQRVKLVNELSKLENQYACLFSIVMIGFVIHINRFSFANQRLRETKDRYQKCMDAIKRDEEKLQSFESEHQTWNSESDGIVHLINNAQKEIKEAEEKARQLSEGSESIKRNIATVTKQLDEVTKKIADKVSLL